MRSLSKAARKGLGAWGKRLPVYIASIATWFCTGIWHGFSPNFILWGMLNCFVIVISEELAPLYEKFHGKFPGLKQKALYGAFEMLRMFFLMNLIRACDLFPNVGEYFSRMGSLFTTWNFHILWDGTMLKIGLAVADYVILLCGIVALFTVSILQERGMKVRQSLRERPMVLRHGLILALLIAVLLFGNYGIGYDAGNFIYNQF